MRSSIRMKHTVAAALGLSLGVSGAFVVGQVDQAAWDKAQAAQRQQAQPTYQHSPVFATFGSVTVNLHAITSYREHATNPDWTLVHPGPVAVQVPLETFDQVVKGVTRTKVWQLPQ